MSTDTKSKGKTGLLILVILIALVAGAGAYLLYRDTTPPVVSLHPGDGAVSPGTQFSAGAQDSGSGLKSLAVDLIQNGKTSRIAAQDFPGREIGGSVSFNVSGDIARDGNFTLRVTAVDAGLSNFGKGASRTIEQSYVLDSTPPSITLGSSVHNVRRGGTGCVVYTLSEPAVSTGVLINGTLYPGHLQPSGEYAALFPFPYFMTTESFNPQVTARDEAGNEALRAFKVNAQDRKFRFDRINIPDSFLARKSPEMQKFFPDESNPLAIYLKANNQLRAQNAATIRSIGNNTSPVPLWNGTFVRMNGATRSKFGDKRDYYYNDQKIDEQTHLGVDIARTLHAPVPAANDGMVVFVGDLGIYGRTVIVDHGLGLQSLYAHLSQTDVQTGDAVQRKQIVGKTGVSGLAGGDHLHFGMYVAGMPVTPLEWWDGHWIKNNITGKLAEGQ